MRKKLLKDVTDQVGKRLNINKRDAYIFGVQLFKEIIAEMEQGNSVMIFECGIFKPKLVKGRDLSYFTGKVEPFSTYFTPKFVFSDKAKEMIKKSLNKE